MVRLELVRLELVRLEAARLEAVRLEAAQVESVLYLSLAAAEAVAGVPSTTPGPSTGRCLCSSPPLASICDAQRPRPPRRRKAIGRPSLEGRLYGTARYRRRRPRWQYHAIVSEPCSERIWLRDA